MATLFEAVGAAIEHRVAVVLALRRSQERPILSALSGDEMYQGGATSPPLSSRRVDTTTPLLDGRGNPEVPTGMPVVGRLTSAYGRRWHPILRRMLAHHGEDIAAPAGAPVTATADGTVVFAGAAGTYGNLVEVDHGKGCVTRYAHLQDIAVRPGDAVVRGAVVGSVGATGRATGPHVHYEVLLANRPQDPRPFLGAGR